jgi:hypothetical protein
MPRKLSLILCLLLILSACVPQAPQPEGYGVVTHPDGALYVGDRVSFEVFAPAAVSPDETIEVSFDGRSLGSAPIVPFGIGQREQATLWWAWDTRGLQAGKYTLTFNLAGGGTSWDETITLRPAEDVPAPEPQAAWTSTQTDCCIIHYITGTAAARDIDTLATLADEQSAAVAAQMGASLQERIPLIFMPRVIGHGGFAWDGVYISYLDNNYVGNEMELVLHHEFVHYYDDWIGGEYMPVMLQEGLAVYLSGGHFKPEPLGPRAAALLDLGWYIPLTTLLDDFYNQQHDVGYLEAAALVQYLYETYGPGAFIEFYRTIPYPEGTPDSITLDLALQNEFGSSLASLETRFKQYLASQMVTDDIRRDLELTAAYFDAVRRYQSLLDPSAYFLTAWLPDGRVMREQGIVADLTRHPLGWKNRLVEWMLMRVHNELFSADYSATANSIEWTDWILDVLEP